MQPYPTMSGKGESKEWKESSVNEELRCRAVGPTSGRRRWSRLPTRWENRRLSSLPGRLACHRSPRTRADPELHTHTAISDTFRTSSKRRCADHAEEAALPRGSRRTEC